MTFVVRLLPASANLGKLDIWRDAILKIDLRLRRSREAQKCAGPLVMSGVRCCFLFMGAMAILLLAR